MIVDFSQRARRDLTEIGVWIARDDPDTAKRFVDRLEAACWEIGQQPRIYPFIVGSKTVRKRLVAKRYLILFRVRNGRVTIVSVRHGARRPFRG